MRKYQRVVATAGTSAFGTNNLPRKWLDATCSDLLRWERVRPVSKGDPTETLGTIFDRWAKNRVPVEDPKSVSAEFSTLHALRTTGRLDDNPVVVLIHSDTFDGELAARLVERLLQRELCAHVQRRKSAELDAEDPARLRRSLGAFMQQVGDALRGGEPSSTCFAPLGGYKVMTSLGYVAGAFLKFPTTYLHEGSQVRHEIPWVPIQVDEKEIADLGPLVRRTVQGVNASELTEKQQRCVDASSWLFERIENDGDEFILLNAFGHFLRSDPRYRPLIGTAVHGSGQVETCCKKADRCYVVAENVTELLRQLEQPESNRATLRHEVSFGHKGTTWHLFKGTSGPQGVFRAVYRWSPALDQLDLKRVWFDHDDYERASKTRATFEDNETDEHSALERALFV